MLLKLIASSLSSGTVVMMNSCEQILICHGSLKLNFQDKINHELFYNVCKYLFGYVQNVRYMHVFAR